MVCFNLYSSILFKNHSQASSYFLASPIQGIDFTILHFRDTSQIYCENLKRSIGIGREMLPFVDIYQKGHSHMSENNTHIEFKLIIESTILRSCSRANILRVLDEAGYPIG